LAQAILAQEISRQTQTIAESNAIFSALIFSVSP